MNIYAAYKSRYSNSYWLYELREGYNFHYWHCIGPKLTQSLPIDGPIFLLKRDGGQIQEGDMDELCEFSPL